VRSPYGFAVLALVAGYALIVLYLATRAAEMLP